jgi:glycosyltransferase involved in cell wall biosynthesis
MGSEPGMAWNWCIHLAQHCELHIITEGEFRSQIEATLPALPQGKNMHFYYNPVPEKVRKMCWNQGDWRFYKYYKDWQIKTYQVALEIIRENHIDILHQLNMIGFREPGFLWKIEHIPFIWGPINAKESIPFGYFDAASFRYKLFFYLKTFINRLQLKHSNSVKSALSKASFVIAASTDSAVSLSKYHNIIPIIINESGCSTDSRNLLQTNKSDNSIFELLWVGRFIFTKQLKLALDTIMHLKSKNIRLHIVGGNKQDEIKWKSYVEAYSIQENFVWHGKITQDEVQHLMRNAHLFFFTSIFEGTPHVVLEAISNALPILCFNTCGQGDCVNEKVGIKIELSNSHQSIIEFAEKIRFLETNRMVLKAFSANCKIRQEELSWDVKATTMLSHYEAIVENT